MTAIRVINRRTSHRFVPSPEQIRLECAAIQAEWPPGEEELRRTGRIGIRVRSVRVAARRQRAGCNNNYLVDENE